MLTLRIARTPFAAILDGSKTVEYRDAKRHYDRRIRSLEAPFPVRLIAGYAADAPEAVVTCERVEREEWPDGAVYALYLAHERWPAEQALAAELALAAPAADVWTYRLDGESYAAARHGSLTVHVDGGTDPEEARRAIREALPATPGA
jgi:hypothetical protein